MKTYFISGASRSAYVGAFWRIPLQFLIPFCQFYVSRRAIPRRTSPCSRSEEESDFAVCFASVESCDSYRLSSRAAATQMQLKPVSASDEIVACAACAAFRWLMELCREPTSYLESLLTCSRVSTILGGLARHASEFEARSFNFSWSKWPFFLASRMIFLSLKIKHLHNHG